MNGLVPSSSAGVRGWSLCMGPGNMHMITAAVRWAHLLVIQVEVGHSRAE